MKSPIMAAASTLRLVVANRDSEAVSAVYRSAGRASVGAMYGLDIPTSALPRHRPGGRLSVRAGAPSDLLATEQL